MYPAHLRATSWGSWIALNPSNPGVPSHSLSCAGHILSLLPFKSRTTLDSLSIGKSTGVCLLPLTQRKLKEMELQMLTSHLCQVGSIQVHVNKIHNYLWGTGSFGEVGICTGSKKMVGKAEFPHHEVIKQMVTFWLWCVRVVSMECSETIYAHIDRKMLWNYCCYEVCLLHAKNSYKRCPCTVKRAISD